MSKKRPQIHLNVAELVLFDDDMMYYCNFPLFNEQNSSLFIIICHEGKHFVLTIHEVEIALLRIGQPRSGGVIFLLLASHPKPVSSSINKRDVNLIDLKIVFFCKKNSRA